MESVQRQVLVVDSSASHLFYMAMLLKKLKYGVRTATTAEDALQLITDDPPFLVITDTVLSTMSGINLLKTMKQSATLKPIPVFIHTNQADPAVRETCTLAGCTGYFVKPVAPDSLYRAMQAATEASPRQTIRIDTRLKVQVGGGSGTDSGMRTEEVTTLSEGGLYINSPAPEPVNAVIPLTLFIGGKEIRATAVVLYSSAKTGGPHKTPGMGMKFVTIARDDKALIGEFIKEQITKELSLTRG
jgi:CheY-like chemotaxis protein